MTRVSIRIPRSRSAANSLQFSATATVAGVAATAMRHTIEADDLALHAERISYKFDSTASSPMEGSIAR